jgi:hypothetical protein
LLRLRPLLFAVAIAGCTPSDRLPRHADSSPVTRSGLADSLPVTHSGLNEAHRGPLTGDTLELVSVGGRTLSDWHQAPSPCDSVPIAFERIVFATDSTYNAFSVTLPGCRDERMASSDTSEWESLFRLHGDTLTLYTGDGDEVFEADNDQVFADSVVQLGSESERIRRYRRRPGTHR